MVCSDIVLYNIICQILHIVPVGGANQRGEIPWLAPLNKTLSGAKRDCGKLRTELCHSELNINDLLGPQSQFGE